MATATAPAPEATSEREQRHCPECGDIYFCKPRWMSKMCPACKGQRIAQGLARRRGGMPTVGTVIPHTERGPELTPVLHDLDRELETLRGIATTLEELDEAARARVLAWIVARYGEQVSCLS